MRSSQNQSKIKRRNGLLARDHLRFVGVDLSPSQRREGPLRALARGELGTNSARLFAPGKKKAQRRLKLATMADQPMVGISDLKNMEDYQE